MSIAARSEDESRPGVVADHLVLGGIVVAVAAVGIQTFGHLTNGFLFGEDLRDLNATGEGAAFTWADSMAAFGASLAAALCAILCRERRRLLALVAVLLAYVSLDDTIGTRLISPMLHLSLFGLAFGLLWRVSTGVAARPRLLVRTGLGLLVVTISLEVAWPIWYAAEDSKDGWLQQAAATLVESAELGGWILVAAGLAAAMSLAPRTAAEKLRPGKTDDQARDAIVSRLGALGLTLALVAVAVQTASHLAYVLHGYRPRSLGLDFEGNAFSWASSATTFACALAAALLAVALRERRRRFVLGAVLLAYFSLDDAVVIHELLGKVGAVDHAAATAFTFLRLPEGSVGGIWPQVYLPLLAIAFVFLRTVARDAPPTAQRRLWAGLGLLVAAVAAEALQSLLRATTGGWFEGWPHAVEVIVEENLELAGWIFIAVGLAEAVLRARLQPTGSPEPVAPERIDPAPVIRAAAAT